MRKVIRQVHLASLMVLLVLAGCGTTSNSSVNNAPVITALQASAVEGPAPLAVTFSVSATDPDGDALSYLWDIAGQQYPGGSSYAYTFTTPGEHAVGVTVSDGEYMVQEVVRVTVNASAPGDQPQPPPTDPVDPEPPTEPVPPEEPTPPAPPEEPAPPPEEPAPPGGTVESVIVSDFDGFEYGNIYELANGQIWEQTEFYFWFYYYYRPEVLIYPSQGQMKMKVSGIDYAVTVTRIR